MEQIEITQSSVRFLNILISTVILQCLSHLMFFFKDNSRLLIICICIAFQVCHFRYDHILINRFMKMNQETVSYV